MGRDSKSTQKAESIAWRVKLSREEADQEIRDTFRLVIRNWVLSAAMLWVIWYPFREILVTLSPRVSDSTGFWILLSVIASAWALLSTGLLIWMSISRDVLYVTRKIDENGVLAGSKEHYALRWSQVAAIREDRSDQGQLNRLALFGKDKTMSYLHLPTPVDPRIIELIGAKGFAKYDALRHGKPIVDAPLANWVIVSIAFVVLFIVLCAYLLSEPITSQIEASRAGIGFWMSVLVVIAIPVVSLFVFCAILELGPRQKRSFVGWMLTACLSLYILIPMVIWADRARELLREMRSIDPETRSKMEKTIRGKSRTDP